MLAKLADFRFFSLPLQQTRLNAKFEPHIPQRSLLGKARPDTLEKNIEPVIEALPTVNVLKKVTFFNAIFQVLFEDPSALEDITPIRKKALLLASEEVKKDPGFINRKEVFDAYGLPHDAYALRQLAGER